MTFLIQYTVEEGGKRERTQEGVTKFKNQVLSRLSHCIVRKPSMSSSFISLIIIDENIYSRLWNRRMPYINNLNFFPGNFSVSQNLTITEMTRGMA